MYRHCIQKHTRWKSLSWEKRGGGAQPGYLLLSEMDRPRMVMEPSMREVISIKLCLLGSPNSATEQNQRHERGSVHQISIAREVQTCLHSNTVRFLYRKVEYFCFFSHRPGTGVAILVVGRRLKTKDSTMSGSDLHLDRNVNVPLMFLALSPSALFHFILFSVKIISK